MQRLTLREAARRLGLPATTLSTYVTTGKIPKPKSITSGRITIHLWAEADIERVRKLLPKIKNGRKTRYRKKATGNGPPTASRGLRQAKGKANNKKESVEAKSKKKQQQQIPRRGGDTRKGTGYRGQGTGNSKS